MILVVQVCDPLSPSLRLVLAIQCWFEDYILMSVGPVCSYGVVACLAHIRSLAPLSMWDCWSFSPRVSGSPSNARVSWLSGVFVVGAGGRPSALECCFSVGRARAASLVELPLGAVVIGVRGLSC